jgi:hypothetical protein
VNNKNRSFTLSTFEHICDRCGATSQIVMRLEPTENVVSDPFVSWLGSLTPETRSLVDEMDRNGLLRAYTEAANAVLKDPPRNPAKSLLNYLQIAGKMPINSAKQLVLTQQFGRDKKIEILQSSGVMAIIIDGRLCMFAPKSFLESEALKTSEASRLVAVGELAKAAEDFSNWRKTKMGYVPTEASEFFAAMRKRSFGEFAKAGM